MNFKFNRHKGGILLSKAGRISADSVYPHHYPFICSLATYFFPAIMRKLLNIFLINNLQSIVIIRQIGAEGGFTMKTGKTGNFLFNGVNSTKQ